METNLVITAVGKDRPGLLDDFSRIVLDCGCSIGDSRMAVLGDEFALVVLLTGNWNAIAKAEAALPRLESSLGLEATCKRTRPRENAENLVPYGVEVVCVDHPGVLNDVAAFFARREINIEDVYTSCYPAPHTGAPMYALHMTIGIRLDMAIAAVRGEFMDFCDELNLDGMIAPVK